MVDCPHCGFDPLDGDYGPTEAYVTDVGDDLEIEVTFRCGSCDGPLTVRSSAPTWAIEVTER